MKHHRTMGLCLALVVLTLGGSPAAAVSPVRGRAACPMSGMQTGTMQPGMRMQRMQRRGMYPGGMVGMQQVMTGHGVMGHGMMGSGPARAGMQLGSSGNMADMQQIHTLLADHEAIRRMVRLLPNGVETVTTSPDPRIAALLPQHVQAMYARLKDGRLIRGFDPLFVELFRHAGRIEIQVEPLRNGVRVVETSRDPYAVKLIQAHAEAVSGFVRDGMAAMHRTHAVPGRPSRSSSDGHHSDAVP